MTSWVREQYVANYTSAAEAEQPAQAIGDTGGDGVSHRNVCEDDARLSAIGGWADGTAVEVIAVGRGPCDGWLWVETDTVSSWVRDQYLVEPAASPAPEPSVTPTPVPEDRTPEAPAIAGTWVIANTGGSGVSHRRDCTEDARISAIGGWSDGTVVELLEVGSGRCTDWVRVRATGVTSWVRDLYVVSSTADSQSMVGSRWVIGNTDGLGVSHRDECADAARVGSIGGWPDGTIVTARAAGEGLCAGWLWVEASDGVTSWVREEYLVESLGPAFPVTGGFFDE